MRGQRKYEPLLFPKGWKWHLRVAFNRQQEKYTQAILQVT